MAQWFQEWFVQRLFSYNIKAPPPTVNSSYLTLFLYYTRLLLLFESYLQFSFPTSSQGQLEFLQIK